MSSFLFGCKFMLVNLLIYSYKSTSYKLKFPLNDLLLLQKKTDQGSESFTPVASWLLNAPIIINHLRYDVLYDEIYPTALIDSSNLLKQLQLLGFAEAFE